MSQYFSIGDETLWNPSNGASRLFLRHVAVFEAELGVDSGISPMQNDECRIDPAAFTRFVAALLAEHRRTSHAVIKALSDGFVVTVLVLAERAGVDVGWADLAAPATAQGAQRDVQLPAQPTPVAPEAWADALRREARDLSRFMPR